MGSAESAEMLRGMLMQMLAPHPKLDAMSRNAHQKTSSVLHALSICIYPLLHQQKIAGRQLPAFKLFLSPLAANICASG